MTTLIKVLDAVEADTTSSAVNVEGAKKIGLWLHTTQADTDFSVTISLDGTNFVTYNKIITNVTNTNSQMPIRVATIRPSASTYTYATLDPIDPIKELKVVADENTGAVINAWVYIEY